ncbi:MAG: hypothetical protein ACR2PZ_24005 [Pseudomonadales bacterium]
MAATASHTNRDIDWYVITDEADLTLRIANGLRVGEDRWGELTLNHPVAAHRWLEFTIEQDGSLSCRPCRRDVAIEINGEPQNVLQLQPGDPIQLPHNRVHISDSFKRGPSDAEPAVVRCVEVDESSDDAGVPTLEQIVITESDLALASDINQQVQSRQDTLRYQNALADKLAERINPADARTTGGHDSIETALIPVDAESPFAANEVSESLKRPISSNPRRPNRGAANSPVMTPALSEPAPRLRAASGLETAVRERRSYTYLWTLSAILGVGLLAAILVAINSASNRDIGVASVPTAADFDTQPNIPTRTEELLTSVQNIIARSPEDDPAAWEFAVRSYEYILAQEPENAVVRRRLAAARNRVAALRAQAEISQEAATASTTVTAAATKSEAQVQVPAQIEAQAQVPAQIDTQTSSQTYPQTGSPANAQTSVPTRVPELTEATTVVQDRVNSAPSAANIAQAPVTEEPFVLPIGAASYAQALTPEQIDSRLRLARQRLAEGQIIAPLGSSASALALSILANDPSHREAINLLNACADLLVNQAELAYEVGDSFQARNSLEEVLAFHPRHSRANARWLQWTGSPSRYR